jgi:hypothetical protein
MARHWMDHGRGTDGILFCDGDVAIDPDDIEAMDRSVNCYPNEVNVAPVRLWPTQWQRTEINGYRWVWGHAAETTWPWDFSQQLLFDEPMHQFTFCFTYLPADLIEECIRDGMEEWCYPGVDGRVMSSARKAGTPVRLVEGCWPKHLNY